MAARTLDNAAAGACRTRVTHVGQAAANAGWSRQAADAPSWGSGSESGPSAARAQTRTRAARLRTTTRQLGRPLLGPLAGCGNLPGLVPLGAPFARALVAPRAAVLVVRLRLLGVLTTGCAWRVCGQRLVASMLRMRVRILAKVGTGWPAQTGGRRPKMVLVIHFAPGQDMR